MRKIRLNENQFNRLVNKCVKKALNEGDEVRDFLFSRFSLGENPRAKADRRTIINVKIVG